MIYKRGFKVATMDDLTKSGIKILNAHAKLGTLPFNAKELAEFLNTPELLVHLGTIDGKGEPDDVRPTWYYFDSLNDKLYVGTNKKLSKMIHNLEKNNKTISFCIDDSRPDQYKDVRGKADASSCIKSKESEGGQFEDETSLSSRKPSLAHSITPFVVPSLMERRNNHILLATAICDHWGTSTFTAS